MAARRGHKAARGARERPESRMDPRLVATRVLAQDGVPVSDETFCEGKRG